MCTSTNPKTLKLTAKQTFSGALLGGGNWTCCQPAILPLDQPFWMNSCTNTIKPNSSLLCDTCLGIFSLSSGNNGSRTYFQSCTTCETWSSFGMDIDFDFCPQLSYSIFFNLALSHIMWMLELECENWKCLSKISQTTKIHSEYGEQKQGVLKEDCDLDPAKFFHVMLSGMDLLHT